MNKIAKWAIIIIVCGAAGLGFWIGEGMIKGNITVTLPSDYVGQVKRGTATIESGETHTVTINLKKVSHPTAGFGYTDTVTTDCITRTYETGEFLTMQVLDPNQKVISEKTADVQDAFFVCALNLKEGVRERSVVASSGLIKVETEGQYSLIITNTQQKPVDVRYSFTDEAGRMKMPHG